MGSGFGLSRLGCLPLQGEDSLRDNGYEVETLGSLFWTGGSGSGLQAADCVAVNLWNLLLEAAESPAGMGRRLGRVCDACARLSHLPSWRAT